MSDEQRPQRDGRVEDRSTERRRPRQVAGREGGDPQRERRDQDAAPRRPVRERSDEERSDRRPPRRPDEDAGSERRPQRRRPDEDGGGERRPSLDDHDDGDREEERAGDRPARLDAIEASEHAVAGLRRLTRRPVEGVVAVAPEEDGAFTVTVEVLELERVPSTADVLAEYEVRLDVDGRLLSYHRGDRYARGSTRSE